MKLITLLVTETSLAALDNLVLRGLYPSRAEAIRLAIHDLIELHRGDKTWQRVLFQTVEKPSLIK